MSRRRANKKAGRGGRAGRPKKGAPTKAKKNPSVQVYLPQDLLSWINADCKVHEAEIRKKMGLRHALSRSAHLVSVMHQYRMAREFQPEITSQDFWATVQSALKKKAASDKRKAVANNNKKAEA